MGTGVFCMTCGSTRALSGDSHIGSPDGDLSGLDLNGYTLFINGVAFS